MYKTKYNQIIQELREGKQPRIELSDAELEQISEEFHKFTEVNNIEKNPSDCDALKQVICVVNHLKKPNHRFHTPIIKAMKKTHLPDDIKVFLIQTVQKHIIDYKTVTGNRLSYEFLESLKEFFNHSNNELTYWALSIIKDIGSQNIFFKDVVNAKKWRFWDAFYQQNQLSMQIINELNEQWKNLSLPTK